MVTNFHIEAHDINNLKDVNVTLPYGKIICFTGKSGSGKSTLAFEVIYRAGRTQIWRADTYTVSKLPAVWALQQKTRTSLLPVSVAKYLGLTSYLLQQCGHAECSTCGGTGIELSLKRAIADDKAALAKLCQTKEFRPLLSADGKPNEMQRVVVDIAGKCACDDALRTLFNNVIQVKSCPCCNGIGTNASPSEIEAFFGNLVPRMFTKVADLLSVVDLSTPVNRVGATSWQWIRLVRTTLEISDGGLLILDEPMAGMTAGDASRMMNVIHRIADAYGLTVILIEHAESAILGADYILEMGPGAGALGGEVVFTGPIDKYLSAKTTISRMLPVRCASAKVVAVKRQRMASVFGINEFGFENARIEFPLLRFTCIAGRTQTGKTGLLDVLSRAFDKGPFGWCERLGLGEVQGRSDVRRVQSVSQAPIGNNPHSVPATYINAMTALRDCFDQHKKSADVPYEAFSFNSKHGMCPECGGFGGTVREDDAVSRWEECHACGGNRYNPKVRAVKYAGLNIGDFLKLTMSEVSKFKDFCPAVFSRTSLLEKIGLGYLTLGQPSPTLSGGEAQRIKLGKYLAKKSGDRTLYILDNPSKGLSVSDVPLLIQVLRDLSKRNTVVVADNHPMFLNECDYLIMLDGNSSHNKIVYSGVPKNAPLKNLSEMYRS